VLLSAYFFLTILPVTLVEASYVYSNPDALANHAVHRLGLTGTTASLFRTVLIGAGEHRFVSVLLAILNLALFGLGFGRVLQLVHARSWGIDLRKNALIDQARYAAVLTAMVTLTFVAVLQTKHLSSAPAWIGWLLDLVWLVVLVGFFTWTPRVLLHRRVAARDLLPGAVFTVVGLVTLRIISTLLLVHYPLHLLDNVRSPGHRDGTVLLDHPARDDPRTRLSPLTRHGPSSRPYPHQAHNPQPLITLIAAVPLAWRSTQHGSTGHERQLSPALRFAPPQMAPTAFPPSV
jgi:hypothetical protein